MGEWKAHLLLFQAVVVTLETRDGRRLREEKKRFKKKAPTIPTKQGCEVDTLSPCLVHCLPVSVSE